MAKKSYEKWGVINNNNNNTRNPHVYVQLNQITAKYNKKLYYIQLQLVAVIKMGLIKA